MGFDRSKFIQTPQPDPGELASQMISLLSISVMAILFGIKTYNVQFKYLSYSRWLILGLYVLSWGFTLSATVFASTNNGNYISCLLSEIICDFFYTGTKVVIYFWLIEKVWVVSANRQSRWKTVSYRIHTFLMAPYIGIFALMVIFHVAEIQDTGLCVIGLSPIASIPLLVYDFVFNAYMTFLFVKPLMRLGESVRADWKSSRLHLVAKRTLIASIVSLFVSFANVLALTIFNGRERGVICLTCCTIDVLVNVITIHWVTTNGTSKTTKDTMITSNLNTSTQRNDTNAHEMEATTEGDGKDHHLHFAKYVEQDQKKQQRQLHHMDDAVPAYDDAVMLKRYEHKDLDEEFVSDSRSASIQESQSSRRSLTKK